VVPRCWKLPAAVLVAGLCGLAGWSVFKPWQAERLRFQAEEAVLAEKPLSTAMALLERSARLFDHPETARLAGEVELIKAHHEEGAERLWSAAADFEHAVARDPYRASTWILLENTYRELGRNDLALASRRSAAGTCPGLQGL
jgi:tetratricopeptide (TPR) repeat protein